MTTSPCMVCQDNEIDVNKQVCDGCKNGGGISCPFCSKSSISLASLRQHVPSAHDGKVLPNVTCSDCGKRFHYTGASRKYCEECSDKIDHKGGRKTVERIERECERDGCEEVFEGTQYEIEEENRRFCSQDCYNKTQRSDKPDKSEKKMDFHPKARGIKSEAAFVGEMGKREINLLSPFGDNNRYDYVIEHNGEFERIQVKTANQKDEKNHVKFCCASTGTWSARRNTKEDYEGDIDYFAVYHRERDHFYLVPIEKAPKANMSIRYGEPENASPNINWAEDYLLENRDEIEEWRRR